MEIKNKNEKTKKIFLFFRFFRYCVEQRALMCMSGGGGDNPLFTFFTRINAVPSPPHQFLQLRPRIFSYWVSILIYNYQFFVYKSGWDAESQFFIFFTVFRFVLNIAWSRWPSCVCWGEGGVIIQQRKDVICNEGEIHERGYLQSRLKIWRGGFCLGGWYSSSQK